ncbi:MAG: ribosome recycling factor [Erysipelotrichaceae bacterium]
MAVIEFTNDKMTKVIEHLEHSLSTVRTGRANPNILSDIHIDYYGSPTPINQLAQLSVVEGTQIVIKAFDPSVYKSIEKAIAESSIDLPVNNDGTCLRLNVPSLTAERRKELTKVVAKYGEEAKVNIRNIRRDANEMIKKDKELTEDLEKDALDQVQKATDKFVKQIDQIIKTKSDEIMTI